MFLNSSAKEALIGVVSWYDEVNAKGTITIDDLARFKMFADYARSVLETNKEMSDNEKRAEEGALQRQRAFEFTDDDVPF